MQLKTDDSDLDEKKTVKIQLDKRQLVRLKSQKILTDETISNIASQALARYFEDEDVTEKESGD